MSDPADLILEIIRADNRAWTAGLSAEGPEAMYAENAVLIPPGFGARVEGCEAIRQSYAHFLEIAKVLAFDESEEHVDVHGDSAVATYRFTIQYELNGQGHQEAGREVLVFVRQPAGWRVVWRTQVREG